MINPLHGCKPSFSLSKEPHRKLKQASQLYVQEKKKIFKGNVQKLNHYYSLYNKSKLL